MAGSRMEPANYHGGYNMVATQIPNNTKNKTLKRIRDAELSIRKSEDELDMYWNFLQDNGLAPSYRPDRYALRKRMEKDGQYRSALSKWKKDQKVEQKKAVKAEKKRQKDIYDLELKIAKGESDTPKKVRGMNKKQGAYLVKQLAKHKNGQDADLSAFPKGLRREDEVAVEDDPEEVARINTLRDSYANSLVNKTYEDDLSAEDYRAMDKPAMDLMKQRLAGLKSGATTTAKKVKPTYGKKPRSGWGRITIDEDREGANYGEGSEVWIDPNGNMVRRVPTMKDEQGNTQYEVSKKPVGGGWKTEGVMVGNDQNSFIPDKRPKPPVAEMPKKPQMTDTWDEIPEPVGGSGYWDDEPMPEPTGMMPPPAKEVEPVRDPNRPSWHQPQRGLADVGEVAKEVYGSVAEGMGAIKEAWNRPWDERERRLAPENYEEPMYEPEMTPEDEEYLRQMEEDRMLEERRRWAESQKWGAPGMAPGDGYNLDYNPYDSLY